MNYRAECEFAYSPAGEESGSIGLHGRIVWLQSAALLSRARYVLISIGVTRRTCGSNRRVHMQSADTDWIFSPNPAAVRA